LLWDLATRREVFTLKGHSLPIIAVAFSPDGSRLASGGNDRVLKIWSAPREEDEAERLERETWSRLQDGTELLLAGRCEEAVQVFAAAAERDPGSAEAHARLGTALRSTGKPCEAARSFRKALEIDPAEAEAKEGLLGALLAGDCADLRSEMESLLASREAMGPKQEPLPFLKALAALQDLLPAGAPELAAAEASAARAEAVLREALREDETLPALWDAWLELGARRLRRAPAAILAAMPAAAGGRGADLRWTLEALARREAIRINCGGESYRSPAGQSWSHDQLFLSGFRFSGEYRNGTRAVYHGEIQGTEDDPIYQTERWFPRSCAPAGYRIPLVPGRYRVTLCFAEIHHRGPGQRTFDVLLEGKPVLEGFEPLAAGFATAHSRTFVVEVADAFLDIELVHRKELPKLSGIEIERLD